MQKDTFQSDNSYKSILEAAVEGILIAELATKKLIYANPAACSMFGYKNEQLLDLFVTDIHPEENLADVLELFESQARGEIELARAVPCQRRNGTVFWADINTSKVVLDGVPCNVGFFSDVTGRRDAEEAIDTSERLLLSVFDAVPDLLIVIDKTFRIRYTNFKGHDLIKQENEEKGKTCYGRFKLLDEPCEDCSALPVFEKGCIVEREMTNPADGLTREVRAFPIKNKKGEVTYVVEYVRDITERKQAEEDRLKLEKQIQQTQKLESLGIMAGGIAHDFNNLLSGIFGNIDMARMMGRNSEVGQYLETALGTIDRARSLTHQLLTFAKGGAPVKKTGNIRNFVRESAQFALSGSNVSCNFDLPETLWLCDYDESQLGQALDNLVINAQQAMPMGGRLTITGENISLNPMEHATLKEGNYVKLTVKDSGIGIPKEIQSMIFDPFFTTKQQGSGLGLATSYSIIKQHEGHIDVDSEPGAGSTFHLYLPACKNGEAHFEQSALNTHSGSGRVLIMDDEAVVRLTINHMIKTFGYDPDMAETGDQALNLFNKADASGEPYVAIILDLTIAGGMGGKEVVQKIRTVNTTVPVFVSSGYADDPIVADPQEYGFTASIRKPFTASELAKVFNEYVT